MSNTRKTNKKLVSRLILLSIAALIVFGIFSGWFYASPYSLDLRGSYVLWEEDSEIVGDAKIVHSQRYEMITVPHQDENPYNYYYHEIATFDGDNLVYRGTFTKLSAREYIFSGTNEGDEEKITIDRKHNIVFEKSGDYYEKTGDAFFITPPIKEFMDENGP